MWLSNAEGAWKSSATQRTTPQLRLSARAWARGIGDGLRRRTRACRTFRDTRKYPAAADRSPGIDGGHHPYTACRDRAAAGISPRNHRLGGRGALGGIVLHAAYAALRSAFSSKTAGRPHSRREYGQVAESPVLDSNLA